MIIQGILNKCIRSGPAAVETELGKMPALAGFPAETQDSNQRLFRYTNFIKEMERERSSGRNARGIHFLLGYFHQRAGKIVDIPLEKEEHFKQSLTHYRTFLQSSGHDNPDTHYFAQWQTGVLLQSLGKDWPTVETRFLRCLECDITRGEAINDIVGARFDQQEWRIAHVYSSYCMTHFWGNPPANRYWHVNGAFYRWKILRYHLPILVILRKREEVKALVADIRQRMQGNTLLLNENDRLDIDNLIKSTEEEYE